MDDEGTAEGSALQNEFPGLDVIRTEKPAWWTGGIVLGIERARAAGEDAVLFFNQDVTCAPDYFAHLLATVEKNPGALVGSTICYAQEPARVWSAGGAVEWWGRGIRVLHHGASSESLPKEPFPADWLFGMGTYVPVEVFDRIGLPDAARFPMAWGDLDFSLRAGRAGIPVVVAPAARLFHEVGDYDARVAGAPSAEALRRLAGGSTSTTSLSRRTRKSGRGTARGSSGRSRWRCEPWFFCHQLRSHSPSLPLFPF